MWSKSGRDHCEFCDERDRDIAFAPSGRLRLAAAGFLGALFNGAINARLKPCSSTLREGVVTEEGNSAAPTGLDFFYSRLPRAHAPWARLFRPLGYKPVSLSGLQDNVFREVATPLCGIAFCALGSPSLHGCGFF